MRIISYLLISFLLIGMIIGCGDNNTGDNNKKISLMVMGDKFSIIYAYSYTDGKLIFNIDVPQGEFDICSSTRSIYLRAYDGYVYKYDDNGNLVLKSPDNWNKGPISCDGERGEVWIDKDGVLYILDGENLTLKQKVCEIGYPDVMEVCEKDGSIWLIFEKEKATRIDRNGNTLTQYVDNNICEGLAVDQDDCGVWVMSLEPRRLIKLNDNGKIKCEINDYEGTSNMVTDSKGSQYSAGYYGAWKYSESGNLVWHIYLEEELSSVGYCKLDNSVWVSEEWGGDVYKLNADNGDVIFKVEGTWFTRQKFLEIN